MSDIPSFNQNQFATLDAAVMERREIKHQHEKYHIQTFTERSNPEGAFRAQQIQGESYVAAGFVYQSALDEYGRLQPELDRSRGDNIIYKLATAIDHGQGNVDLDQASVRINPIPKGGRLDDLTEYKYIKDVMSIEAELELRQIIAERGTDAVKGLAALSKTNEADQISSFEIIRNIFQESVQDKTDETWLITFAKPAYIAIRNNFGERAVTQIAEPVAVDVGDDRTDDNLRLVPCVIKPGEVLDGLVKDITEASDIKRQMTLVRSLYFLSDGLKPDEMSDTVNNTIAFLDKMRESQRS